MTKLTVAYLGPPASYTHQAAASTHPSATLLSYPTISSVFSAIQHGNADRGVVPFENSTYGPVLTTLDLFSKCLSQEDKAARKATGGNADGDGIDEGEGRASDGVGGTEGEGLEEVEVCGEAFVQVRHCLLGRRQQSCNSDSESTTTSHSQPPSTITTTTMPTSTSAATPTPTCPSTTQPSPPTNSNTTSPPSLTHLKQILSHPQALGQCRVFLSQTLPHVTLKEVSSTSAAAEQAAADQTGQTAALSSAMAADVYGLDVLREGVQDKGDNVTRFMVLRRRAAGGQQRDDEHAEVTIRNTTDRDTESKATAKFKALILFTVSHTSPGALAEALAIFKTHELNLTSINTRPSGAGPWNYFFYVEVEGVGGDERRLESAMVELKGAVERGRCLGWWAVV